MAIYVEHNNETDKYDILKDGNPMVNANGNRVDGGGHDMKDKAERQTGYIIAGEEKKAKKDAEAEKEAGKNETDDSNVVTE